MTTWLENAVSIIEAKDREIPDDVPLKERRKILSAVRPSGYSCTSWGRKVWPKAMKQALAKYHKDETAVPVEHLSPLERMMRKVGQ